MGEDSQIRTPQTHWNNGIIFLAPALVPASGPCRTALGSGFQQFFEQLPENAAFTRNTLREAHRTLKKEVKN